MRAVPNWMRFVLWVGGAAVLFAVSLTGQTTDRGVAQRIAIEAVPIANVSLLEPGFWTDRLEVTEQVTIPHIFRTNEEAGRTANFQRAAARSGVYQGRPFQEAEVYQAIEAASYILARTKNPELANIVDKVITAIAAAQEPDGYLFPARAIDAGAAAAQIGPERWMHLNGSFELANAAHLYEAAVAHFAATGSRKLLDVAARHADLVRAVFGPRGRKAVPGHPGIERALAALAAATNRPDYLDLARFFIEQRGGTHDTRPYPDGPLAVYNDRELRVDYAPVLEHTHLAGHATRALSLYSGLTDLARLADAPGYWQTAERLWQDLVAKRLHITGVVATRSGTERIADEYELPPFGSLADTCAAAGVVDWSHRMFLASGDARYLDLLERALYNGLLSGVALAGDRFFDRIPLVSEGLLERRAYLDEECGPGAVARTLARVPGLIYGRGADAILLGLFAASEVRTEVAGTAVRVTQRTLYPWDGDVEIRIEPETRATFTVAVRLPGWSRGAPVPSDLYRFHQPDRPWPTLIVNGQTVRATLANGFARVTREWRPGDVMHLYLPMPVQRVLAYDAVQELRGRAAFTRGPLVYTLEQVDNGPRLSERVIGLDAPVSYEVRRDLLGGVAVLTGPDFLAVPYHAWANRRPGEMLVWLRY
jgi:DUF1680 family protein